MTVYQDKTFVPDEILMEVQQTRVQCTNDHVEPGDIIELLCGARMYLVKQITREQFREATKDYPRWGEMLDRLPPSAECWQVSFD